MAQFIYGDWLSLCRTFMLGVMLAIVYDGIRIWRRIVVHRHLWSISAEDILFWMCSAIAMFALSMELSSGVVRLFWLIVAVLGAVLYKLTFSRYLVRLVTRFLRFLIKIISFPLKKLGVCLRMIISKLRIRVRRKGEANGNGQTSNREPEKSDA